jgi:hypothetical protein
MMLVTSVVQLFGIDCAATELPCRALAKGMKIVTSFVSSVCRGDKLNDEGRDTIEHAKDLLVDRNIFERDFVDSNAVFFCSRLRDILAPFWIYAGRIYSST